MQRLTEACDVCVRENERERESTTYYVLHSHDLCVAGTGAAGANSGAAARLVAVARADERYDDFSSPSGVRRTALLASCVTRLKTRERSCSSVNSAGAAPCASAGPSRSGPQQRWHVVLPSAGCRMSSTTWAP